MQTDTAILDGLAWVSRAVLGLMFLVSGIAKLRDPSGFVAGALVYEVLPVRMVRPLAYTLPFVEAGLGLALLVGMGGRPTAIVALLLVMVFGAAVVVNVRRGHVVPCYCLGVSSNEVIGAATLARLAVLGLAAGMVLRHPHLGWWPWTPDASRLAAFGSTVLSISTLLWWLAPTETILREAWSVRRATLSPSRN